MASSNQNSEHRNISDWQSCPKGTLAELTGQLHHDHTAVQKVAQRRRLLVTTGVGAGLLATGGVAAVLMSSGKSGPHENTFGGISCSEVKQNMVAFRNGSLETEVAEKIKLHLGKCDYCKAKMQQMTA